MLLFLSSLMPGATVSAGQYRKASGGKDGFYRYREVTASEIRNSRSTVGDRLPRVRGHRSQLAEVARRLLSLSFMTSMTLKTSTLYRATLTFTSIATTLVLLMAQPASATEVGVQRKVGVGLVAGSAPGITAKIWTSPVGAVDLGFGFGLGSLACSERFNPCGKRNSFNLDYLWQSGHGSNDLLGFHIGLGARFWIWNYGNGTGDFQVAARMPIGLDLYAFKWLEVYGEVAPSLAFDPGLLFFEGAIGARIYL